MIKLENHQFAISTETPNSGYAHHGIESLDESLTAPFATGALGRHHLKPPPETTTNHPSITREEGQAHARP